MDENGGVAPEQEAAPPGAPEAALARATARLVGEPDDSRVGRVLVEQVAQVLAAADVRLGLLESGPEVWVLREAIGPAAGRVGEHYPEGTGVLGQILQGGEALWAADRAADHLTADEPEPAQLGSVIVALLRFKDELLGAVLAGRPCGRPAFTANDGATLQVLADMGAARLGVPREAAGLRARARELVVMNPLWRPAPAEADDFVVITNRERRFIDVDEAACRVLGYTREALLQRGVGDIIPLPPWANEVDTLGGVREQMLRGIPVTFDSSVRRQDGSLMPVRMTLQMLPTPEGLVTRGIFRDLSMEKQAHLQALQAEKQRLLQEIGSGLAHELNTPLAILMGNVEMALEECQDPDLRALLTPARDAAERVSVAVQSIQRFAKPVLPGTWTAVDLSQLAAEGVEQTRQMWEGPLREGRPIRLYLELFPVSAVRGDPIELEEAIRELLANAVQALPQGGTIVVRTEEAEGQARLSVADDGIGMSEDVRLRCIEPFFTTRRPAATGLGLNRVHHTVLRHRGNLMIESTVGEGSRVTITLPLAPTEVEDPPAGGASIGAPPEA